MQQQNSIVANSGKIALRYGLIFGLIQAVIGLIAALIQALTDPIGTNAVQSLGLAVLIFLTSLAAYFIAGILASKRTGKVSTGTISGLWAGVFYGVLGCIITIAVFLSIRYPKIIDHYNTVGYPTTITPAATRTATQVGGIGFPIFGIFVAIGIGAGIGALGGLLGRSQARKNAPQLYQEQPYPAQPYPGQPYPAQPNSAQSNPYAQPYPAQPYPAQPNPAQSNPYAQPNPAQPYPAPPNPAQSNPYAQPFPQKQSESFGQSTPPSPTEGNPYNSD